ncbi:hypothetical protein J1614_006835 [Plenodomus biglobosus]|nr:hypothetical protein J1614_006835 [Plenodomus biglobosus]
MQGRKKKNCSVGSRFPINGPQLRPAALALESTAEEMRELEHLLRDRRLRPTMANRDISPIDHAPFGVF